MHSSTGSPTPTCSHDHRASISTPPPHSSSSPGLSNVSVPNSPAASRSDHTAEWPKNSTSDSSSGSLDTGFASLSLTGDARLIGLGFNENTTVTSASVVGAGLGNAATQSHPSSPTFTAVASPSVSVSPTPTAYTTPSDSALPSPLTDITAELAVLTVNNNPSVPSLTAPETNETCTPSSLLESTPSSLCASPTFTTVTSASISPATKFVLSPAVTSPAITMSGSTSNHSSPFPTDVVSLSQSFASPDPAITTSAEYNVASGSPTPHATATTSPIPDAQVAKQDVANESNAGNATKHHGAPALQSPLSLLNSNIPPSSAQKRLAPETVFEPAVATPPSPPSEAYIFGPSHEVSQMSAAAAHDTSSTLSTTSSTSGQSFKTPNVYINGLPPNFPEEQLYNMTKDFGGVISVRTFTRHVSERPTGYGFVLFETLEGAERCIEALRKYRNLHPSFSKQIHKIPGTLYSHIDTSQCDGPSGGNSGTDENSFKVKMEKLKDVSSTNLYIEGLPLSIDERTLAALVSPYSIKSSRFFQTKLSHPPRIIAFVRLETRAACEEVIERLHGRMVRGWNDPGCRISVRFADSNEQRELRKKERFRKDGCDGSPNRLTMAQAALLNLRGSEINNQKSSRSVSCPSGTLGVGTADSLNLSQHSIAAQYQQQRDMQLLLDSLKNGAVGLGNGLLDGVGLAGQGLPGGLHGAGLGAAALGLAHPSAGLLPGSVDVNTLLAAQELNNWNGSGSTQAGIGGFTQAEQLLLQAHAQARARLGSQRVLGGVGASPSLPISGLPGVGRGVSRTQVELGDLDYASPHGYGSNTLPSRPYPQLVSPAIDVLPAMSEDEFHTALPAGLSRRNPPQRYSQSHTQNHRQQHMGGDRGQNVIRSSVDLRHDLDLDNARYKQLGTERRQGSTTNDPLLSQRHVSFSQESQNRTQPSSLHIRATTLPPSHLGAHRGDSGYDVSRSITAAAANEQSSVAARASKLRINSAASNAGGASATRGNENAADKEHSPLVSPALTYASRTPSSSSFSPATPYFNAGGFDGYEGVKVNVGVGDQSPAGLGLHMVENSRKGKTRAASHT